MLLRALITFSHSWLPRSLIHSHQLLIHTYRSLILTHWSLFQGFTAGNAHILLQLSSRLLFLYISVPVCFTVIYSCAECAREGWLHGMQEASA